MRRVVYVKLLDEGVDCWRPVDAELVGANKYRLVSGGGDEADEHWESGCVSRVRRFATGTIVRCEHRVLSDGEVLVAVESVAAAEDE